MLIAGLLGGCNWDDDSEFKVVTKASFFLVSPVNGGESSVLRLENGQIIPDWNGTFGIGNLAFTDFTAETDKIWIADGLKNEIQEINLVSGKSERTYDTGDLIPHCMAVGTDFLLFGDSAAKQMGFLNLKNRDLTVIDVSLPPQRIVYNAQKFYIQFGTSVMAIYNELAFAPVASFDLQKPIIDFQLNTLKQVDVLTEDSTGHYLSTIEANGDFLSRENIDVSWIRKRSSPYFSSRFGSEFLGEVFLREDSTISANGVSGIDADAFEMDFFESVLQYTHNDSLFLRDLQADSLISGQPFPWIIHRGWHYIGTI